MKSDLKGPFPDRPDDPDDQDWADDQDRPYDRDGVYDRDGSDRQDRPDRLGPVRAVPRLVTATSVFALVSTLCGLFFVFRTPLLWGFDETSHVARAYQVSRGQLVAPYLYKADTDVGYGGMTPASLVKLIAYTDHDLASSVGQAHVHDAGGYASLARAPFVSPGVAYAFPNTAAYSPLAYVPSATAIRAAELAGFDLGNTIYLARLSDLAFYTVCVTCALHTLRKTRFRWLLFVVALLPVSVFEASTVTADAATNAVVFLLSALLVRAFFVDGELSRAERRLLFLSVVALPVLKPTYVLVDPLVLLVPDDVLSSRRVAVAIRVGALAAGLSGFALWQWETSGVARQVSRILPGTGWRLVDPSRQLQYLLGRPLEAILVVARSIARNDRAYLQQVFGQLSRGNVDVPVAAVLLSAAAALVAVVFLDPVKRASRSRLGALGAVLLANVGAIFIVEYLCWTAVGVPSVRGVYGRYFVPLLVLALSALAVVSPLHTLVAKRSRETQVAALICFMVVASLVLSCLKFDQVVWT
jgi:uncharacterized membrane protein